MTKQRHLTKNGVFMSEIYFTKNKQIAVTGTGDLFIMANAGSVVDTATWRESLDNAMKYFQSNAPTVFVNYVPNYAPPAAHRAMIKEYADKSERWRGMRFGALITESTAIRGAVTAMSWIVKADYKITAYAPSKIRLAIDWLHERGRFQKDEALRLLDEAITLTGAGPSIRWVA